jgi:hypothetical protein
MNRIPVTPRIFADLSVILRQAKSLTVRCMGQEFTDLVVTEEGGHVVVMVEVPTPWEGVPMVVHTQGDNIIEVDAARDERTGQTRYEPPTPKRRGRPPKAKLEGGQ